MRVFIICILGTIANLPALPHVVRADEKKLSEKDKIEALIKHVENLKDVKFVRNDTEYDAKSAAKFMRGKWERDSTVKTAKDFIEKCASKSSTSGKDYLIRSKDGKDKKAGEYLNDELKKIEDQAKKEKK